VVRVAAAPPVAGETFAFCRADGVDGIRQVDAVEVERIAWAMFGVLVARWLPAGLRLFRW
jgi:hypothetical protein